MSIVVSSSAFAEGDTIPRRYTCEGDNVSPPLTFSALPSGTRDVALLMEDPDAPGGFFVHWVTWGVDPGAGGLAEGQALDGAGMNDFRRRGYGGPCPPRGPAHRYVFTVFALSRPVELRPGATADDLRRAIDGSVLAQGRLMGRYARA